MKYALSLGLILSVISTFGQNKKISLEISSTANFSTSTNRSSYYENPEGTFRGYYYSSKKFDYPFFTLTGNVSYPLNANIDLGLTSGMYFFIKQTHHLDIERTFIAVPLQMTFDYHIKFNDKNFGGLRVSPGILFYKMDEALFKTKNGLLISTEIYYAVSAKSKLKLGFNTLKENTKLNLYLEGSNTYAKNSFFINRNALYIGYSILVN